MMFDIQFKNLTTLLLCSIILLGIKFTNVQAQQSMAYQKISLPSCDVSISADETLITSKGITYMGNVKVLIGFANLRIDRITLVKKKNGKCELVSTI